MEITSSWPITGRHRKPPTPPLCLPLFTHLPPSVVQAQRKADALRQSLAALGETVKTQTAPNKDVQKEIADMTEVWPVWYYTCMSW